jgi:hypothetical protein
MMNIKIWDNKNKQWLEPMSIIFGNDECKISEVNACIPGDDPIFNGWYKFKGKDLKHIAIVGDMNYNSNLIPNDK